MNAIEQFVLDPPIPQPSQGRKRAVVTNACQRCKIRRAKCTGIAPCRMCQNDGLGGDCLIDESNDLRFKKGLRKVISDMGIKIAGVEHENIHLHRTVDQQAYMITQLRYQIADNRAQRSRSNNQRSPTDGNIALEFFEPMVVKASDSDLTKLIDLINAEISKRKFPNETHNEFRGASRASGVHSNATSCMPLAASGVTDQPAMDTRNEQDMHLLNGSSDPAQNLILTATTVAPSQLVVPYYNYNWENGANSSIQQNSNGDKLPPNAVSAHQNNNINQQHGDFASASNDNQSALELQTTTSYSQTQYSMHQGNNPAQACFSGLQNGCSMQTQAPTGQSYANQQGNAPDPASFGGLQNGRNMQTQTLTVQSYGEQQGDALDQVSFGAIQGGFNTQTQAPMGRQYATQQENTPAQEYPGLPQNGFNSQTQNLTAQQNTFQIPNTSHGLDQSYNYAQSGMSRQENYPQQMGTAQGHQQTFGHQQNYKPQNMDSGATVNQFSMPQSDSGVAPSSIAQASNSHQHSPYPDSGFGDDVQNISDLDFVDLSFLDLPEAEFDRQVALYQQANHDNNNMGNMNFSARNSNQSMSSHQPADDENSNASHEEQYMSVANAQALVNFINFGQS